MSLPLGNGSSTIVPFGHGSRDPLWRQPMDAVAARIVQRQPGHVVVCAFLELAQPDLSTAVASLVNDGATRISVLPLFLGVGKHAREDLMEALRAAHPQVAIHLQPAVGENPLLIDLLAKIALDGI